MLNIHFHKRVIINQLDYQYKEYLRSVVLYFGRDSIKLNNLIQNLPSSVKIIEFGGSSFNSSLFIKRIPSNLKTLRIGYHEMETLDIPDTLTSLDMGEHFASIPKSNFFPSHGLVYLNLGDLFNDCLPKGCLPLTLRTLKIGKSFQQKMKDIYLPCSITDLSFGDKFSDSEISKDNLPVGLLKLSLGSSFRFAFNSNSLPKGLLKLKVSEGLDFGGNISASVIPVSITSLKFNFESFNFYSNLSKRAKKEMFPLYLDKFINLRSLRIGSRHTVVSLPNSLQKFTTFTDPRVQEIKFPKSVINYRYIQPPGYYNNDDSVKGKVMLPINVCSVYYEKCNSINNDIYPKSVRHLSTIGEDRVKNGYEFPSHIISFKDIYKNRDLVRDYSKLIHLKALSTFYCYEDFTLPNNGNLKILEINYIFNNDFLMHKVPSSVNTLIIKGNTNIKLPLPSNIKSIYVHSTNYYFLNKINFRNEPDLLEIIKVVDSSLDIFEKLIQDL